MPTLPLSVIFNKNTTIGVLVVIVVVSLTAAYRSHEELKKIQTVYRNPEVKTVEKIVRVEGPVKIVTRIVERQNEKETTIEETHEPITQTTEAKNETTPVPVAVVMAPARTDRYLVSAGMNRLSMDFDGKAFFAGYGFKNRVDVQIGGIEHNGWSPWVLATFRF